MSITITAFRDNLRKYLALVQKSEATREALRKLLELFSIADTAAADCQAALIKDSGDFEDAVMMETAKRIKADYIVTRNTKDYAESRVPVLDPKAFVSALLTDC